MDQLKTMFAVTLHTYPLTLAVAIITISRRQKWFRMRIGSWCFAGAAIVFCAALANLVSQWTGTGYIAPAQIMQEHQNSAWSMPAAAVNATGGLKIQPTVGANRKSSGCHVLGLQIQI